MYSDLNSHVQHLSVQKRNQQHCFVSQAPPGRWILHEVQPGTVRLRLWSSCAVIRVSGPWGSCWLRDVLVDPKSAFEGPIKVFLKFETWWLKHVDTRSDTWFWFNMWEQTCKEEWLSEGLHENCVHLNKRPAAPNHTERKSGSLQELRSATSTATPACS